MAVSEVGEEERRRVSGGLVSEGEQCGARGGERGRRV